MRVLIIVDAQKDFISKKLGSTYAIDAVPNIVKKIQEAHAAGDMVVFTRDTHYADYLQTQEGRFLPVEHCMKDTDGWQLDHLIAQEVDQNDEYFDKSTFGSFELANHLITTYEACGFEEIELCGFCTDICVIANAVLAKTACPQTPVVVDSKACAGVTPEKHEAALEVMRSLQIHVI